MKDEILKIVYDPKTGFNECADQLTALMCYREVKSFCGAFVNGQGCTALEMAIRYLLKEGYSTQEINKAVEQVKKEMK